jgi:hypothetical protein
MPMKHFSSLLLVGALLFGAAGCKDAPVDPATSTSVGDTAHDQQIVPPERDTCKDCQHSDRRPMVPYFGYIVKKSPVVYDTVDLNIHGMIQRNHIDTMTDGSPKAIQLEVMLDVPPTTYPTMKDIRRIDFVVDEQIPAPHQDIRLRSDPQLGRSGAALWIPDGERLQRLTTADSALPGNGPGRGHSQITLRIESVDKSRRMITGMFRDGEFIVYGAFKTIEPSPIYFRLYY